MMGQENTQLSREQIELLLTMMKQVNWPGLMLKLAAETMAMLEKMLESNKAAKD